ncbi:hypothetical protein ACWT_3616 [Actinoplanes sp. SE50]|uniref:hypothetical protein n=1 Tax=unclassified Actinoplanes TaxID=2626549 RepID=UPI00023EC474|nr:MULTISPECIES: hypothetical protein [unclassified Actinoplanes]AEV84639.1 yhgE-like uncharacterized protein [Actinoplanes sp. SE50/110]ATO83031.1 hypothetical protein ACWT_3616 [Actinoplanes sp. SE50]SLM00439.1 hypothetical protein ACSP50_3671 [Actinoplanes sp. SE50/110]
MTSWTPRRAGAVTTTLVLTGLPLPVVPARAAEPDALQVTDQETVTVRLDASGVPVGATLVDVLAAHGSGTAVLRNPSATAGLRNLVGYGRPDTSGDRLVQRVTAGDRLATASTVTGAVPITLHAHYELDGATISPAALRGRSGHLKITYTVTNRTAEPTAITYRDAGKTSHTVTEKVFLPLVGDLVADLPSRYRDVSAEGGTVAGTATGGSHVAYNLVLAPPMGNPQATVTLSAAVTDAEIPDVTMQLIPATTGTDPASRFAGQTFTSTTGANTHLADAAGSVDDQVVSLRAGVAGLADGLTQLATGADALQRQLTGQLVPGADATAAGAARTSTGARRLAEGTGKVASSADALSAGTRQLSAGLTELDTALSRLSGAAGMSASLQAAQALQTAVEQIAAQLGSADDPDTVLGALHTLGAGAARLHGTLSSAAGDATTIAAGIATGAGTASSLSTAASGTATLVSGIVDADCGPNGPLPAADCADLRRAAHQCTGSAAGMHALSGELSKAATGLRALGSGLGQAEDAAAVLSDGISTTAAGLQRLTLALSGPAGGDTAKGVAQGLDALVAGLAQQVHGITALASATGRTTGVAGQVNQGAAQLAAGSSAAAAGAGALATGAGKVAGGSAAVADGTRAAATGAGRLATEAGKGADGGAAATRGAGRLHSDGTQKLTDSIVAGSATPAEVSALFTAMDRRAAQALPYGAPEGATGSAMWQFRMDGTAASDPAGASTGDGTRITVAVGLLVACVLVTGLVRRWKDGADA